MWRQRKEAKKRPLPQRRLSPVPSLRPQSAGRIETRPAGSDIDATIPAGRRLRSALQKGKATAGSASPLPAACSAFVSGTAFGHDSSPRRRPGSRAFDSWRLVRGAPSAGGDWHGTRAGGRGGGGSNALVTDRFTDMGSSFSLPAPRSPRTHKVAFGIARSRPCRQFGLGSRPRFVAPAQAGVQCLWSLSFAWWRAFGWG